jgi:hypothetical protein
VKAITEDEEKSEGKWKRWWEEVGGGFKILEWLVPDASYLHA